MNRVEVKSKLRGILREMLLSDLEAGREIPQKIVKQILENYGCAISEHSDDTDDLNSFVKHLQEWIESKHFLQDDSCKMNTDRPDCDFSSVFQQYLESEAEYCAVTEELISVLEEVMKQKEKYSEYFKNKCKAQETKMQVLNKKCQCLEINSLLHLFKEENALKGHLALQAKLKNELNLLKKCLREVTEYNKSMSEVKNDKTFCELFQQYTELKKIEERAAIIAQLQT